MTTRTPDERTRTLRGLFPTVTPDEATDALIDAEAHRRGMRDAVSGAFHALALTQGNLIKEEYDLSTHGHGGWQMGAVVVDIKTLTLINMKHGFPEGDGVMKATVRALESLDPAAKVVRIHADGFAVLLGPTADLKVTPELAAKTRAALEGVRAKSDPVGFTVGLLSLRVTNPSHPQVLSTLVWAECERALAIAQRQPVAGVIERTIELDGGVPLGER